MASITFKHFQRLQEEVVEGLSTLLVAGDSGLQRIVNVMRFRFQREDGRVLVVFGRQNMEQMIPHFSMHFSKGQHYFNSHLEGSRGLVHLWLAVWLKALQAKRMQLLTSSAVSFMSSGTGR